MQEMALIEFMLFDAHPAPFFPLSSTEIYKTRSWHKQVYFG